jgi:hypothetical protein
VDILPTWSEASTWSVEATRSISRAASVGRIERPRDLDAAFDVAANISRCFGLVCVDLDADGNRYLLGEVTNCNSGALERFEPEPGEALQSGGWSVLEARSAWTRQDVVGGRGCRPPWETCSIARDVRRRGAGARRPDP